MGAAFQPRRARQKASPTTTDLLIPSRPPSVAEFGGKILQVDRPYGVVQIEIASDVKTRTAR